MHRQILSWTVWRVLRNKADVVALASILVILMIAVLSGMAMLKPF